MSKITIKREAILTPQDKAIAMIKKNKELEKLIKEFNLKLI